MTMKFTAADGVLRTTVLQGDRVIVEQLEATPQGDETSFRLDTVAICSYSDEGQPPAFAGSVLATGLVDNLWVATPPLPVTSVQGSWEEGDWTIAITVQAGWTYELKRTGDLRTWETVDTLTAATSADVVLRDAAPRSDGGLYRVEASRP